MGDTIRRGRGMKVGNGVVKRECVRFLLSRNDGSATESEIRAHLLERFGVQDRATIRKQHLGYLRTRGWIDVVQDPGKENVWLVADSPSTAEYIFAEFAGDDLAEVYRLPFVREHVVDWYRASCGPADPAAEERARHMVEPGSWEEEYLLREFYRVEDEAIELSPSLYTGATLGTHGGNVAATLLLVSGRPGLRADGGDWNPPAMGLGLLIADLLIDFERYGPLRREIYEFMRRPDLQELMAALFPPEAVMMVFQCLRVLTIKKPGFPLEDCTPGIATEPMAIPPPPPDWLGA